MTEIVVLGAGVVGMASAYALVRRGYCVTVVDEGPAPAMIGASFGNGAQLSYPYSDAMASPSLLRNLPRYLLGRDEAFRWKPSISPAAWLWNLRFLANGTRSAFERNTLDILALALERPTCFGGASRTLFDRLRPPQGWKVAHPSVVRDSGRISELKSALGVDQQVLIAKEAIEREPVLARYAGPFAGTIWSPIDELGEPVRFCHGLRSILEAEYGVRFLLETRITGLRRSRRSMAAVSTSRGELGTPRVVLALGSGSVRIARSVGLALPIWPMQGYSVTVPATPDAPTASITDVKRKLVLCRIGQRLRVAVLADLGGAEAPFMPERAATLVRSVLAIFPKAGQYDERQ